MDKTTTQPLYLQVKEKIIGRIQAGRLKDGDMLPTEEYLSKEYEVSRATIRNALDEIEKEQLIVRRRGVGTIIKKRRFKKELMKLESFTNLMKSRGMKPSKKTLKVEIIDTPTEVLELYRNQKTNKSWFIKRILLADKGPIGLQYLYLPTRLNFSPDELINMDSFYELITKDYDLKPYYGEEILTATTANKGDASLMQINEGDPLLNIWRTVFDEDECVFEVSHLLYIADLFEYEFKLYA